MSKTIDNNLLATHVAFWFSTAVKDATDALDKLRSTAESHHWVIAGELMGRYADWIALAAGAAGGMYVILIPEIPHDIWKVSSKIIEREKAGCHSSIVVIAEASGKLNSFTLWGSSSGQPRRSGCVSGGSPAEHP